MIDTHISGGERVPARLNAHLDRARTHSKAWARDVGLLDGRTWDERRFDAEDRALLCAYTHPDAAASALDLVTDWYVWAGAVAREPAGARRSLDRLAGLTPANLADAGALAPAGPIEHALADLWWRTAPRMSVDWRLRFAERTHDLIDGSPRLPPAAASDPFEHVALLRLGGGAPWSAGIVEYAVQGELPGELAGTTAVRALNECFADAVHLGEDDEAVPVVQRFLRCDRRTAADVAGRLASSRRRLFEHVAGADLPELLDECTLGPAERDRVLAYVRGLRAWLAGREAWLGASARRPAGPERAAPVASAAPAAFRRPAIATIPARINPFVHGARIHAERWARAMGMLGASAATPLAGTWGERGFRSADIALFAALTHPDAQPARLELITDWHLWRCFVRDAFVEACATPRDLAGGARFLDRVPLLMPDLPLAGAAGPVVVNPVERGLSDLWSRTAPGIPIAARGQFRAAVRAYAESLRWELRSVACGRLPDPVDYVETRRRSAGAELSAGVVRLALGGRLPAAAFAAGPMRELTSAFADIGAWRGDVLSGRGTPGGEDQAGAGAGVLGRLLGGGAQEAANAIGRLVELRTRRFEQIAAEEVPALAAALALDEPAREQLCGYVDALRQWLAGDLAWALGTERRHAW